MTMKCFELNELKDDSINIDLEGESDDILILSASFEERGLTLAKKLDDKYRCENCIIYYNEDNQNYYDNLVFLESTMRDKTVNRINIYKGSHRDAKIKNTAMNEIADFCRKHKGVDSTNVAIDITGFTKIDLIVLLDFLVAYIDNMKIKLIYVSPKEHGDWLSKGFSGICNIPGFCGNYDILKKTALIILSGFEKDRPKNLIEEYEPQEVYLGLSNPAVQDKFGQINRDLQEELLSCSNVKTFDFSAKEMSECYEVVRALVEKLKDEFNIVIAPLCTKLSAVACFKVAKEYPNIQLIYCYPQEYNYDSYSLGSRKVFVEYVCF